MKGAGASEAAQCGVNRHYMTPEGRVAAYRESVGNVHDQHWAAISDWRVNQALRS